MDQKNWQALRESGFRVLFVGAFSLAIAFIIYSQFTMPSSEPVRVESEELTGLAWGMLAISAASMASMVYGAYIIFRSEQIRTAAAATTTTVGAENGLISFITAAFSNRNYWKIMMVAAVGYGIFFAFL